jgi:maleate isomerase
MIGWRARIGVLLPPDNAVLEYEVNRLPLPGISFHIARLFPVELGELPQDAPRHIPSLKECRIHFIVYACAASSFMFGPASNDELEKRISELSGLDAVTATSSMILSLKALGIRRVALATPYWRELDEKLLSYFAAGDIRVVNIQSLQLDNWEAMNNQTPNAVYRLARKADHPDAEGILVLSTNLPTFEVLQVLEDDLGKPVVSTNQGMVWTACRRLGIRDTIAGFGSLWQQKKLAEGIKGIGKGNKKS